MAEKGILITVDGLPMSGKSYHVNALALRLSMATSRRVDVMSNVEVGLFNHCCEKRWTNVSSECMGRFRKGSRDSQRSARRLADLHGGVVLLERHICNPSAMWWVANAKRIYGGMSYYELLDSEDGRPDLSLVLDVKQRSTLITLRRNGALSQCMYRTDELAMLREDLVDQQQRWRRNIGRTPIMLLSRSSKRATFAKRLWKVVNETFPELCPDNAA